MNVLFKTNVSEMDILEKSVSINRTILRVWACFAIAAQLFNLVRVCFYSASGLTVTVNRIYFVFYLFLLLWSILFLLMDCFVKLSLASKHRLYMLSSSIFLFWYTFFNIYDIYTVSVQGSFTITTIVTGMVVFSSLLAFRPTFAVPNFVVCYAMFMAFLYSVSQTGAMINFTFTAVLCVAIYCARYKDICMEIEEIKTLGEIRSQWMNMPKNLSQEQYELIREKGGYITFEWDIQKDCIYFSKEIKDYFNYPASITSFGNFIKNVNELEEEQKKTLAECMDNVRNGVNFQKHEFLFPIKTGEKRWFEVRIITQMNEQEQPVVGIGILFDVTELKDKIAQLEKEIRMDLFTGLLNKASVEYYGARKLKDLNDGEMLGMMIMDVDDFKNINDHYGHPVGDYVLKEIADIIRKKAPDGAKIGRMGGDEFIILSVIKDIGSFRSFGEELLRSIPQIRWQDEDIRANCSIGLAASSDQQDTYEALYKKADSALYEAKKLGKNQLRCVL